MGDKDFICDLCEYEQNDTIPCDICCVLNGTDYFEIKSELRQKLKGD